MTDNIKVVVIPETLEEAYRMGYNEFEDMENPEGEDFDIAPFHDSARYCNHILPKLRCMAGYRDNGHGTYQENGKVVTVEAPKDRPMNGHETEAHRIFDEIVEAWHNGAYDGIDGEDYGTTLEV